MLYKVFGCKVNKYFLNTWLNYFKKDPLDWEKNIIVSTCVVTDRAKTKFVKETKKYINQWYKVYLTGCAVISGGKLIAREKFFEVYQDLLSYSSNIILLPENPDTKLDFTENIYTKKFIVIQNWCDNNCSFCMTVLKRWKSYSFSGQEILTQINDFEKNWGKEIVLTWVNLAWYWSNNTRLPANSQFNNLLKSILNNTGIQRIRISSLWPEFLNDEFFEIICNPRIMPHFHLSIQSFSDDVLQGMKRNYDSRQLDYVLSKFRNLKRLDFDTVSIGADIIVWFPGETEDDFQKTYEWIQKFKINKLHIFPFSAHTKYDNVPAGLLPNQIPKEVIKQREKFLSLLWEKIRQDFLDKNVWKKFEVLVEQKKTGKWIGWTPNYIEVALDGDYKKWDIILFELITQNMQC